MILLLYAFGQFQQGLVNINIFIELLGKVETMKHIKKSIIPFLIGISIAVLLYIPLPWWGFLIIFPWIGFSISVGVFLRSYLKGRKRLAGRKVSILMILPCLLLFVPIVNNENFQMEGVVLIVAVGFFSKGFIHYAIAKIFGPLIWRRGFCGHACWTAAVLDWLPIKSKAGHLPDRYKNIRYIALFLSFIIPLALVFYFSYDPWTDYINKQEMKWMFVSNGIYYLTAIPLAFLLSEKRAFCKYVCPVSIVMKPSSRIGLITIKPDLAKMCIQCGACNAICPMDVDAMKFMAQNKPITDTECILCNDCKIVCPVQKFK
jgi:polyferredoxin